jgi:hypothetical protein
MKRIVLLSAVLLAVMLLSGCGGAPASTQAPALPSATIAPSAASSPTLVPLPAASGATPVPLNDPPQVDMARFSDTMAYSQMMNIALSAEEYAGQTIRASGFYLAYTLEDTGEVLHYIAQQDAAACCSIALRFELTGTHQYPQDYPEQGSDILVTGVISTFTFNDYVYPLLVANSIEIQ